MRPNTATAMTSINHSGTFSVIKTASDTTVENVQAIVPKSKFDLDRVVPLREVDPHLWAPIVSDLIDWTCDVNWPSSQIILPLLRSNSTTIAAAIPYVSTILRKTGPADSGFEMERDDEHQNVLLVHFVMKIDVEFRREMAGLLKEFREGVTEAEWPFREGVDKVLGGIGTDTGRS